MFHCRLLLGVSDSESNLISYFSLDELNQLGFIRQPC